jgi:hypothetical protein
MQSVTTSHSATQDRDIISSIAAVWRRAMEFVLSHSTTTAAHDAPERPWYDDPSAGRGL